MTAKKNNLRVGSPGAEPPRVVAPETRLGFPVVGVGASAGGLEAFTRLLRALPVDTGMAFVLVQHLAPSHESALAEILSRATSMPVTEVRDEPEIEPNHVYVIPPDRNMTMVQGHLQLFAREGSGRNHPIDRFFRSLAESQRHLAVGVVLSGTATDGTLGLEEIKAEGGITFAQDDAAYDGMPESAVNSGCVDFVLTPEGIAGEIARIATHPLVASPTDEEDRTPDNAPAKPDLGPILRLLHTATEVDFTHYQPNTLSRRITRRMVLRKKAELGDYEQLLQHDPGEVEALYQDILINVTSFFRDPEVFEAIKTHVIPALLEDRSRQNPLRAWVLGCSTGEEAYSLAMVLSEAVESGNGLPVPQLFATDLNDKSVRRARAGVYSAERLQNVSHERLSRFFVEVDGNFRVSQAIRDMCVFSRHNVMADPPFSRMDIVSCRNLLIYLDPSLQQRVIATLHYALKPAGFLVLGSSETVGPSRDFCSAAGGRHRIFARAPGSGRRPLLLPARGARPGGAGAQRPGRPPAGRVADTPVLGPLEIHREADRLLLEFAPPAVLVDSNLEILQFRGDTEPYLVTAQGKASLALLRMARPGLLVPLRVLIERAKKENGPVRDDAVRIRSKAGILEVGVQVLPVSRTAEDSGGFLVLFEDSRADGRTARQPPSAARPVPQSAEENGIRLEHELASTREYLQALSEQHESAMEDLQSANAEAQSANEELQTLNEELETSKEEIQSSNEELTTLNDEFNSRNLELVQANNDLTNLIRSVQVAVVMVGRDLRIRRFSPLARELLNIIPADVGRSITDIRLDLDLPELDALLNEVIVSGTIADRDVQAKDGRWYSLRLHPYMTLDNAIDGAVVVLVDVDAIRRARDYAESIVATVREPLVVLDAGLRVRSASRSFYASFGVVPEGTEGRLIYELGNGQWDMPGLRLLLTDALLGTAFVDDFMVEYEFEGLGRRTMRLNGRKLVAPGDEHESILLAIEDVTAQVQARVAMERLDSELRKRAEELDTASRSKSDFIAVLGHELRGPLNAICGWTELLQRKNLSADDSQKGLEIIARNGQIQAQLIADLLDSERIASGKMSLELRAVDLRTEIESAIDSALPAAREKGIRIEADGGTDPAIMLGDSARLQQVLGNLLSNAIKFTPAGGEIRIELLRSKTLAEVSVSDTGLGISADVLPYIFERFRQTEPTASRIHGGLGLGLSVSKQLVELHGGSVAARSPGKGQGATFTVSFPLVSEAARPVFAAKGARQAGTVSLNGLLVLVVDDEHEAREPVRRVLEGAGAEVIAVRSAGEGLDAIQQQRPDILVSDIGMPGQDGYYLIRAIRDLPPERGGRTLAIALTAFSAPDDRRRVLDAGYSTHLVKPVDPSELVAAVAALTSPGTRTRPA